MKLINISKFIREIISPSLEWLVHELFPPSCILCTTLGSNICKSCQEKYIKIRDQECPICRASSGGGEVCSKCKSSTNLDGIIVPYEHSALTDKLIYDVKYNFYFSYSKDIANLMFQSQDVQLLLSNTDVITFVPLSKRRNAWRGFNQSEKVARQLAIFSKLHFECLIEKIKDTKPQVGLNKMQRQRNVSGSFRAHPRIDNFSSVIIVDDVVTTGSTLKECANELKKVGYQNVHAIVFTRGT